MKTLPISRVMAFRVFAIILTLLLVLNLISVAGGNVKDLAQAIPTKVLDWQASGKDMVYDRKTIYDYMDGGAEVYLAFDFREVFSRKYKGPVAEEEITLDIFDMGSPEEAYGIFSSDRQDPDAGIGQESEYGPGLLRFWQGRYFVSVTASGDEPAAEKAILELGKLVAARLGPAGPYPALLGALPEAGLKKNRTSYFHAAVNLNNRYFVASENILNLDRETDCVLAEYAAAAPASPDREGSGVLLIVRYPDESSARAGHLSFSKAYLPDAGPGGAALTESRKWTMAGLRGNFLAVVFEAPAKEYAQALLASVQFPPK